MCHTIFLCTHIHTQNMGISSTPAALPACAKTCDDCELFWMKCCFCVNATYTHTCVCSVCVYPKKCTHFRWLPGGRISAMPPRRSKRRTEKMHQRALTTSWLLRSRYIEGGWLCMYYEGGTCVFACIIFLYSLCVMCGWDHHLSLYFCTDSQGPIFSYHTIAVFLSY